MPQFVHFSRFTPHPLTLLPDRPPNVDRMLVRRWSSLLREACQAGAGPRHGTQVVPYERITIHLAVRLGEAMLQTMASYKTKCLETWRPGLGD
jgi:hypothetical protein